MDNGCGSAPERKPDGPKGYVALEQIVIIVHATERRGTEDERGELQCATAGSRELNDLMCLTTAPEPGGIPARSGLRRRCSLRSSAAQDGKDSEQTRPEAQAACIFDRI